MELMKFLMLTLICIFSFSSSYADELSDLILKQITAKEFFSELYIDEYQGLNLIEDEYTITTKDDLKEIFKDFDEQFGPEITSFKIMSRADTEDFVSVTFEYNWALAVGNTDMNGKASGVGVFLKVDGSYISIFDAQTN